MFLSISVPSHAIILMILHKTHIDKKVNKLRWVRQAQFDINKLCEEGEERRNGCWRERESMLTGNWKKVHRDTK